MHSDWFDPDQDRVDPFHTNQPFSCRHKTLHGAGSRHSFTKGFQERTRKGGFLSVVWWRKLNIVMIFSRGGGSWGSIPPTFPSKWDGNQLPPDRPTRGSLSSSRSVRELHITASAPVSLHHQPPYLLSSPAVLGSGVGGSVRENNLLWLMALQPATDTKRGGKDNMCHLLNLSLLQGYFCPPLWASIFQ